MSSEQLPLLFTYRRPVYGEGFVADVLISAAMLAEFNETEGRFWAVGIYPGGIAASGEDLTTLSRDMRDHISGVLLDLAAEAQDFDEFEQAVERFHRGCNPELLQEFEDAKRAVTRGEIHSDLPRRERFEPALAVTRVANPTPRDNESPCVEPEIAA